MREETPDTTGSDAIRDAALERLATENRLLRRRVRELEWQIRPIEQLGDDRDSRRRRSFWPARIAVFGFISLIAAAVAFSVQLAAVDDAAGPIPGEGSISVLVEYGTHIGDPNAPVKINLFLDPLSGTSAHFFGTTLRPLLRTDVADDQIKLVFEPWAADAEGRRAARAILAAAEQDKAWALAARLWAEPEIEHNRDQLLELAGHAGVDDLDAMREAIGSKSIRDEVKAIAARAENLNLNDDPAALLKGPDGREAIDRLADGELAELISAVR